MLSSFYIETANGVIPNGVELGLRRCWKFLLGGDVLLLLLLYNLRSTGCWLMAGRVACAIESKIDVCQFGITNIHERKWRLRW